MNVSFRTKLLASHAAVALIVSGLTLLLVDHVVAGRMEEQVDSRLQNQARAVAVWLDRAGHPDRLAGRLADVVGARVTLLDERGTAVGDSRDVDEAGPAPEVEAARAGQTGRATRYAEWAKEEVRYVAVPGSAGNVVRLGVPIGEVSDAKEDIRGLLAVGALSSSLLALILAGIVARALTRRLGETTRIAQRLGKGDWEIAVPAEPRDEIGVVSHSLATAAAELKLADRQRRELLSNVAHEIRTPVTSIRGFAETLAADELPKETQREFLQTIHRNSLRIGQLVDDLLELEALEADSGRVLDDERVHIGHVVKQASSTLCVRAENNDSQIHVDIPDSLTVKGDAEAIERIVLNLIGNALAYGGKGVQIELRAVARGGRVFVTCSDTGPGVAPEQVARVFERFFRGSAGRTRDQGGSGLGLAIARQLAQAMGGSLYISGNREHGLSVTLELPR